MKNSKKYSKPSLKYKKKHNPAEFLLIELGYKYLNQLPAFDREPIMIRLRNREKNSRISKKERS